MEKFKLNDIQAEAILEIRFRQLAALKEKKIRSEKVILTEERDKIKKTLIAKAKLKKLIREELRTDKENFSGKRRSLIIERPIAKMIPLKKK